MLTSEPNRSPLRVHFSFQANMAASLLWTIQNPPTRSRVTRVTVGLLKEPQKMKIQFLELHVNFSILDTTELQRARAGDTCHRRPP